MLLCIPFAERKTDEKSKKIKKLMQNFMEELENLEAIY
jgi:hypothetical protein